MSNQRIITRVKLLLLGQKLRRLASFDDHAKAASIVGGKRPPPKDCSFCETTTKSTCEKAESSIVLLRPTVSLLADKTS